MISILKNIIKKSDLLTRFTQAAIGGFRSNSEIVVKLAPFAPNSAGSAPAIAELALLQSAEFAIKVSNKAAIRQTFYEDCNGQPRPARPSRTKLPKRYAILRGYIIHLRFPNSSAGANEASF